MGFIWGCDLSLSNSGFSIFDSNGIPQYVFSVSTNSKDSHGKRLKTIAEKVLEVSEKYAPDTVVFENAFTRFHKSTHALYEIRGVLLYLFNDCNYDEIAPTSVKKFITGSGKSDKEEVQKVILNKYENIVFGNLDESDSFGVGLAHLIKNGIVKF